SDNGLDIRDVTFASCAISGLHTSERLHTRNNMSRIFFIADAPISYELRVDTLNNSLPGNADTCGDGGYYPRVADARSGCWPFAAEALLESDVAAARLAPPPRATRL